MDKRTILIAVMKRVPEVYFMQGPKYKGNKTYWCLWCNIKGKPAKLIADMPKTALVSHKELLSTMISEVYDEVQKIKNGERILDIAKEEIGLPPLSDEDKRLFGINTVEDAIHDDVISFLDAATMPEVKLPGKKSKEKPRLIVNE